ncbi:hypothetical protein ACTXT7_003717 [Hymenolepis weldensis]
METKSRLKILNVIWLDSSEFVSEKFDQKGKIAEARKTEFTGGLNATDQHFKSTEFSLFREKELTGMLTTVVTAAGKPVNDALR